MHGLVRVGKYRRRLSLSLVCAPVRCLRRAARPLFPRLSLIAKRHTKRHKELKKASHGAPKASHRITKTSKLHGVERAAAIFQTPSVKIESRSSSFHLVPRHSTGWRRLNLQALIRGRTCDEKQNTQRTR